jgi:ABC-type transporter Mla maintaining outer membrane lipid asymmetry ATPase subunit MlaF
MDLLRVEELTFGIGDRTFLHDVSLRIAPGRITFCSGPTPQKN